MTSWRSAAVCIRVLALGIAILLMPGRAAHCETPTAASDTLQSVLDRVHEHAAQNAWRQDGWKDDKIEAWLDKLTGKIAKAADFPDLKLPVRLADVKPVEDLTNRTFNQALLVGKNFHLPSMQLRNSVILADGNVEVGGLEGCVVVARGAASAARCTWSVIVAGAYVKVGTDGQPSKTDNGSLIATRGWANVQSIHGSIIAAPEGITTGGIPDGGIFVNATLVMSSSIVSAETNRPRSVKVRNLPLEDLPVHPLSKRLAVVGVIYPEAIDPPTREPSIVSRNTPRPSPTGIVFRMGERRYTADLGKPIFDQAERPVAELADWQLSFIDDDIAIFSSGDADAVVRVAK